MLEEVPEKLTRAVTAQELSRVLKLRLSEGRSATPGCLLPQTNKGLVFHEYRVLPIEKKETRLNINSSYQLLGDYRVEKVRETFTTELLCWRSRNDRKGKGCGPRGVAA